MAIPQSTIVTWLGSGLAADLPNATDFDDNLAAGAAARYYAYDTGVDYVLNRNTASWDAIGGNLSSTIEELTDVSIDTSLSSGDFLKFDGTNWVNGRSVTSPAGSSGDIQTNDGAGGFSSITPASGIATFIATPSSANLRAALNDEAGTGVAYFVGGALGTPASGDASNLTNVPVANATGILGATHGGAGAVTGLLKANGSGTVSAASAGTDYAAAPGGTANTPLFNDGSGGFTTGTRSGNTTKVATVTGSLTTGHIATWDADGNAIDGGAVPSGGAGGIGDVTGGSTSTDAELAAYDGTTGKALKQSFAKLSGPATSVKTYTLPNASATILTDNAAVTVAQGGTNATSASGTAVDNISGFSGTGFLRRTGAGTYGFISEPSGTANTPLFNDGSAGFTNGTRSGNTTEVVTFSGSKTTGNLLVLDSSGNAIDGGAPVVAGSLYLDDIADVNLGTDLSTGDLVSFNGTNFTNTPLLPGSGISITNGADSITVALANNAVATAQWVSGAVVANGTIYFAYKIPFPGTIASMDYFAGNGSFTVAVKINGTNVTSLSAITVNSATPANTAATGANTVAVNDIITGVISSATGSPTDAVLSINITRT